jgi:hypothetical protein
MRTSLNILPRFRRRAPKRRQNRAAKGFNLGHLRIKPLHIIIAAVALLLLILTIRAFAVSLPAELPNIPGFLSGYGWVTESVPFETKEITIPASFSAVYNEYNEMQKQQGFDLSRHRGEKATQFTYRITNHPVEGDVFANVIVINNRIVGGDICSHALDGFLSVF